MLPVGIGRYVVVTLVFLLVIIIIIIIMIGKVSCGDVEGG